MFGKEYLNALILDNAKDATLVAGMEGYGSVNYGMKDIYPVTLVLQKPRRYILALFKSAQYSRMGIFNCIVRA